MYDLSEVPNALRNQTQKADKAFHAWYQFVLGYPPHLVRYYVHKFGVVPGNLVLDPFCGTGTTNIECKKLGIDSIGLEANPVASFASTIKANWDISIRDLRQVRDWVIGSVLLSLEKFGLAEDRSMLDSRLKSNALVREPKLTQEQESVLPKDFVSPIPLRRLLILKECIERVEDEDLKNLLLLALASVAVNHAGNVAFGPEVYTTKPKKDVHIVDFFRSVTDQMILDLESQPFTEAKVQIQKGDARCISQIFGTMERKISCIITSPPYPNEKDYTRTTRLESVILGFVSSKEGLRELKEGLIRSNSRNVFVKDNDQDYVAAFESINRLADQIEGKRLALGKTSGFEKLYHKIVKHYFGGMYRHLKSLKPLLAPDAKLAYVVGDQMSFLRIHIPTARILAELAEALAYRVEEIELWRTRLATATRTQLEENVLILRNSK